MLRPGFIEETKRTRARGWPPLLVLVLLPLLGLAPATSSVEVGSDGEGPSAPDGVALRYVVEVATLAIADDAGVERRYEYLPPPLLGDGAVEEPSPFGFTLQCCVAEPSTNEPLVFALRDALLPALVLTSPVRPGIEAGMIEPISHCDLDPCHATIEMARAENATGTDQDVASVTLLLSLDQPAAGAGLLPLEVSFELTSGASLALDAPALEPPAPGGLDLETGALRLEAQAWIAASPGADELLSTLVLEGRLELVGGDVGATIGESLARLLRPAARLEPIANPIEADGGGGATVSDGGMGAAELAGDANRDGVVDGADYTVWADHFGTTVAPGSSSDFNSDGIVDGADYTIWADNFGAVTNDGELDPLLFSLLDAEGNPIPGSQVEPGPDGTLPPFAIRVGGGAAAALGEGLVFRFPSGGRLSENGGGAGASFAPDGYAIEITDAIATFGDDFPLQFAQALVRDSDVPLELPTGPLSIATLAALFDLDPAAGIDFTLLDEFDFTSSIGTFADDGRIDVEIGDLRLSDQICVLGARLAVEIDTSAIGAELFLYGGGGFFPTDATPSPIESCEGLTLASFEVGVRDFEAWFAIDLDGFDMNFEHGQMVLSGAGPFEDANALFGADVCPGEGGSEASLDPTDLVLSFDRAATPPFLLLGDVTFNNLGVAIPGVEGLDAAICSAELHFAGAALPELDQASGVLRWVTPQFRFDSDLSASGWSLDGSLDGTLNGIGTLDLFGAGISVDSLLSFDAADGVFTLEGQLGAGSVVVLADNAALFDGEVTLVADAGTPSGSIDIVGTLGFMGASTAAGTPALEDFALRLESLHASGAFDPTGAQLTLHSGSLVLPPEIELDPEACGAAGSPQSAPVSLDLAGATPLTASLSSSGFAVAGSLDASAVAFEVPGIEGLTVAICSADLAFAGLALPVLRDIDARASYLQPAFDLDLSIAVSDWPLGGLPESDADSSVAGSGDLRLLDVLDSQGDPLSVAVSLVYSQSSASQSSASQSNADVSFALATAAQGLDALDLGDGVRIESPRVEVVLANFAPNVSVAISGDAGFNPRNPTPATLDDYEFAITGLDALATYGGAGLDFTIEAGALSLPPDLFTLDDTLCVDPPGQQGAIGPAVIDLETADPRFGFSIVPGSPPFVVGSIGIANLAITPPDVEGLQATLCSATLTLAQGEPPLLTDADAAFLYDQSDLELSGRFTVASWRFDGLPGEGFSGEAQVVVEQPTATGQAPLTVGGTFAHDPLAIGEEFRFDTSVAGLEAFRITDEVVIFGASVGLRLSGAGDAGQLRFGGDAGMFLRGDFAGGEPTIDDFELRAIGFEATAAIDPLGITLTLEDGALHLPSQFVVDPSFCEGGSATPTAAVIDLGGAGVDPPLSIDYHAGVLDFAGGLAIANVVFSVPEFLGLEVGLCSAKLAFASDQLPVFDELSGGLSLAIPDASDPVVTVDVNFAAGSWGFTGIPGDGIAATGELVLVEPATAFEVSLCYSLGCDGVTQANELLRFEAAGTDLQNILYSDWLAIFEAAASLEIERGGSTGVIEFGGAAGFSAGIVAVPDAPAQDRTIADYQIGVVDAGVTMSFDPSGLAFAIDAGTLQLGELFEGGLLENSTCVGIDGLPASPLLGGVGVRIGLPYQGPPTLAVDGEIAFGNIGVEVPGIDGLAAELCSAKLGVDLSSGFPVPVLSELSGAIDLPIPKGGSDEPGPVRLAISDVEWNLLGYPTGRVSLVPNLSVLGLDGFEVVAIGSDDPDGQTCTVAAVDTCLGVDYEGTGLAICRDPVTGAPRFELDGGFEVRVPANVLALDGVEAGEDATVKVASCGGIAYEASLDPCAVEPAPCPGFCNDSCSPANLPEFHLDEIALAGEGLAFRLGGSGDGSSGLLVEEASLSLGGLEGLFDLEVPERLSIGFGGRIHFQGSDPDSTGVGFGLQGAEFSISQTGVEFTVEQLEASASNVEVIDGVSFDLAGAVLRFVDQDLPFLGPVVDGHDPCEDPPDNTEGTLQLRRFALCNLEIALSGAATIGFGEDSAIGGITGAVDNLVLVPDEATNLMKVDLAQLQGIGFGIEDLEVPPIRMSGALYLGGIGGPPQGYYLAGKLGGMYNGMGLIVDTALSVQNGPIGFCLDVGTGTGIHIIYGFVFIGGRGGMVFPQDPQEEFTDPCDFVGDYFGPDGTPDLGDPPAGGAGGGASLASVERRGAAVSWAEFERLVDERKQQAATLAAVAPVEDANASPFTRGPDDGGGTGADGDACEIDVDAPLEFAPCPPPSISLECQPHPDTGQEHPITHWDSPLNPLYDPDYFRKAVIVKFTSFDHEQVDALLDQIGIDAQSLQNHCEGSADLPAELADAVLTMLIDSWQLPPADDPVLGDVRTLLLEQLQAARDVLVTILSDRLPTCGEGSEALLTALRDIAYMGVPCPQIALKLEGTFSYTGVSTVASVTGGATVAGSVNAISGAGLQGRVNVLGVPVGTAQAYFSATDSQGDPNPGLCGRVHMGLGPVQFGELNGAFTCDGCTTGQMEAMAGLAGCFVDNGPGLEALCRAIHQVIDAPEAAALGEPAPLFDPQCPADDLLQELLTAQPYHGVDLLPSERFARFAAIMGGLAQESATVLGPAAPACFAGLLQDSWDQFQPRLAVGGQAQASLMGFPVTPALAEIKLLVEKDACQDELQLVSQFGFSISTMLRAMNAIFMLNPIDDYGTMGVSYPIPNPLEFLQVGLSGALSSPQAVDDYVRGRLDDFLDNSTLTGSLHLAPFGVPMAGPGGVGIGLEGRLITPNLLDHPKFNGFESDSDPSLPTRRALLLETLNTPGLLASPYWYGDDRDLFQLYPDGTPERDALLACGPPEAPRPCTLRADFFPHGGLVGTGIMRLPKFLTDAPPVDVIARILNGTAQLPEIFSLLDAYLIGDDVLSEIGTLAFYFPGPNPPGLPLIPDPANPESLIPCSDPGLCKQALLDSIMAFDLESELLSLYPWGEVFFEGSFEGRLLGVDVAGGRIALELPESPADPMGTFLVEFDAGSSCDSGTPDKGDWLSCFIEGGTSLTFEIRQENAPEIPLTDRFLAMQDLTDAGEAAAAFVWDLQNEMPKVSLLADAQARIPDGLLGSIDLSDSNAMASLSIYSPGYATGCDALAPDAGVLARAQCYGGAVLTGAFDLRAELPGSGIPQLVASLPTTVLAINLDPTGLPQLSGEMGPGDLALGPVQITNALFSFDSSPDAGAPILSGAGSLRPLEFGGTPEQCKATGLCSRIQSAGGGSIAASFDLVAPIAPDTSARTTLTIAASEITFPILGSDVSASIHGCSTPACDDFKDLSLDFGYSDTGEPWSAGVTFGKRLTFTLPSERDLPVVSLASDDGEPLLRGSLVGDGSGFPSLTAELNAKTTVILFPGQEGEVEVELGAGGGELAVPGDGSWTLTLRAPRIHAHGGSLDIFSIERVDLVIHWTGASLSVQSTVPDVILFPGEDFEVVLPSPFERCTFTPTSMQCTPDYGAINRLSLAALGGVLPITADVRYTRGALTVEFDSSTMRYPADGQVVEIGSSEGTLSYSGSGLVIGVESPTISIFGVPVPGVLAGTANIAYRGLNDFSVDFDTELGFALIPGVAELEDGSFHLAVTPDPRIPGGVMDFGFASTASVMKVPSATGSAWLAQPYLHLRGRCALPLPLAAPFCPIDGTASFTSAETLFGIPGVMEIRTLDAGSSISILREGRLGRFLVSAEEMQVYVLGDHVGGFDTSYDTADQVLKFRGAPEPFDAGPFRLTTSGVLSLELDYNGFDSTASIEVPSGTLSVAPGFAIPGWPGAGLGYSAFTIAENGSFHAQTSAGFDLDGVSLVSGSASLDRSSGGVVSFQLEGEAAPISFTGFGSLTGAGGGNLSAGLTIVSSGAVQLDLGPAELDLSLLGLSTKLSLHGAASGSAPFRFSTDGSWSAVMDLESLTIASIVGELVQVSVPGSKAGEDAFSASLSGVGFGSLQFSTASGADAIMTILGGSALESTTNFRGSGSIGLTLSTAGELELSANPADFNYPGFFRVSTGLIEVTSSAGETPTLRVNQPSLTLFEGAAFEQTISASVCTATIQQFDCGNSIATTEFSSFFGGDITFAGNLVLRSTGFNIPVSTPLLRFPTSGTLVGDFLEVDPTSAVLRWDGSELRLETSNPSARLLGFTLSTSQISDLDFVLQGSGAFDLDFSTYSISPPTLFGSPSIMRLIPGSMALRRTTGGAFQIDGEFDLRLQYSTLVGTTAGDAFLPVSGTTYPFTFSTNSTFAYNVPASHLPDMDLGFFRLRPDPSVGDLRVERTSSGVFSLQARNWDITLFGQTVNNADFSIGSNGVTGIPISARTFDLGTFRFITAANTTVNWDVNSTGSSNFSVSFPTDNDFDLDPSSFPDITGILANGLDLPSFTLSRTGRINPDALTRSNFLLNGVNFGSVTIELDRAAGRTTSTTLAVTDSKNGMSLDVYVSSGSVNAFQADVTGSVEFDLYCPVPPIGCGFPGQPACPIPHPLCPFGDPLEFGSVDTSIDTSDSDFSFHGTASVAGQGVTSVKLGADGFNACFGPVCGGMSWSW